MAEHAEGAIAAEAWIRLAAVLEEQCKEGYAEFAYGRAAELASPEQTPDVLLDLARRFEKIGRLDSALVTYERVVSGTRDKQSRAVAAFRLAKLWREHGRQEGVVELLRTALADASSPSAIYIALFLAEELFEFSPAPSSAEAGEAEHLLQTVIAADHPDLSPEAALTLARLRQQQQELSEAYRLCQMVIDSAHPAYVDEAHELQSVLLHAELGTDLDDTSPGLPGPVRGPDPPPRSPESSNKVFFVPTHLSDRLRDLGEVNLNRYWQPRLIADSSPRFDHDHSCPMCLGRSAAPPSPPNPPTRRPFGAAFQAALKRLLGGSPAPVLKSQIHALNLAIHLPAAANLGTRLEPSHAGLLNVREQILRELLLEAIESETLDLQTVRALIAELPLRRAPTDLVETRVLVPQTRTFGELAIGHYYGVAEEECSFEKGYSLSPRRGLLRELFPDYVEELCSLKWETKIDEKLSALWVLREEKPAIDPDDRCADSPHLLT